ncbi:4-hydroxybenzoate octaprenyltransferase [Propylenella binzhouense]|uniref:4-hydroxybenzoate octaprenyltransferase n=1 Tax=Propylenella binzhouense TaxID=2555902 RepID=A0A964WVK2_9HYPH|nr:4-hydroxybenzoate octaprenyltransferase [Propylenella binzhouense]MYZ49910.1 4-hydroxybenzoate octaprenyltransferase [Propylenella binzhouense]
MTVDAHGLPDAAPRNWLDRYAPLWLKPFGRLARWDRPIGWWLLLWPCWWSAALAAIAAGRPFPPLWHIFLFLVGAIAMRGAGCTYNDLIDRDLDAHVARTRNRPIPSGQVTPRAALVFLVLQSLVGLLVLLQFNRFTVVLGFASLLVVACYPFAKRVTDWPQVVLGFAFSWGALVGWSAQFGRLDLAPVTLYAAAIAWTIGYDTIYALQDREDDAIVGIRSTARFFGARSRAGIALFFGIAVLLMGIAFVAADAGPLAFLGLVAAIFHFAWQVATLEPGDTDNALRRFRANSTTGWIIFAGLLLDAAIRL